MRMPKRIGLTITESLEDLKRIKSKQTKLYLEKRVTAIVYLKEEKYKNQQELSSILGVHERTLQTWLATYRSRGLKGLLEPKSHEVNSQFITTEMHDDLLRRLGSADSSFAGYREAVNYINSKYSQDIGYHVVRDYMINHLESRVKRPRKSHIKKDLKVVDAFLKTSH